MAPSDHLPKKASKRRLQEKTSSRKKAKIQHNADDLPWKTVSRPQEAGLDGDDGILELEEVDGVEVVYEDTEGGRVARFKVPLYKLPPHPTNFDQVSVNEDLDAPMEPLPQNNEGDRSERHESPIVPVEEVVPFDCGCIHYYIRRILMLTRSRRIVACMAQALATSTTLESNSCERVPLSNTHSGRVSAFCTRRKGYSRSCANCPCIYSHHQN